MDLTISEAEHLNQTSGYYYVMQDIADLMRNTSSMPGEAEENACRAIQMVLNHQEREVSGSPIRLMRSTGLEVIEVIEPEN